LSDERKLDVVEQLIPLAEKADLPMTHLAMAFAIATRASPRRSSGRAPWNSSTTCWPAPTSSWTTRFSAGSTRSLRPVPTPAPNDVAYVPPAVSSVSLRRRALCRLNDGHVKVRHSD
jgi:hypothetical protein